MPRKKPNSAVCSVCGKSFPKRDLVAGHVLRQVLREIIRQNQPDWEPEGLVCREDVKRIRSQYIHDLLSSEKGELTSLEHQVLESLREHELLAANVEQETDEKWTLGERLADHIAKFGGSWRFLSTFAVFLTLWVMMNSLVMFFRPVDPYPFILLNLVLSCLASIQAPVIMMSQNRQEAKDRIRSQHNYQVNLKAELEIRNLHEKVDHLLSHQWDRLVEIQNMQLEILSGLEDRK